MKNKMKLEELIDINEQICRLMTKLYHENEIVRIYSDLIDLKQKLLEMNKD